MHGHAEGTLEEAIELVELLGRIEAQKGAIRVLHLDLKRRYEDSARFDASLTVASSAEGT